MDNFGNYLKWDYFENVILEKGLLYFSYYDLERLFPHYQSALKKFLTRKTKDGKLVRLKKGMYCIAKKIPSEYVLANLLYQPSYLSLEFALSFYLIIPESVYSVTSVTTKPTREFIVKEKAFTYNTIKRDAFCGYQPQKIDNQTILFATAEKAMADYLYFVILGKKSINDRINWGKLYKAKIEEYLVRYFKIDLVTVKKYLYDR